MATILYISTYGTDDPTRASLAVVTAAGAVEAGHRAQMALLGEATSLMKDYIAEQIQGVGVPALKELLPDIINHNVPIYV